MAHVYRAIWTDNSLNVFDVLSEEFSGWLRSRGTPISLEPHKSVTVDGRTATWVETSSDAGEAMQIHLREPTQDDAGAWITSLTALRLDDTNVLWADVHNEAVQMWGGVIYAPRVVRNMLLAGGEPHMGRDSVEVQPKEVDDQNSLDRLIDGINDEDRILPYLIIRTGKGSDRRLAVQRATRASETLAGLVQVFLIDENSVRYLNAVLGEDLEIGELGSLLLMPGVMQNPDDARLSYYVEEEQLDDDQKTLGRIILRRVGSTTQWAPVSPDWSALKKKADGVRRNSIQKSGATTSVPSRSVKVPMSKDGEQIDDLERLKSEYSDIQDQLISAMIALEEAGAQAEFYKDIAVRALLLPSDNSNLGNTKGTIRATIAETRRLATRLVIPETAEREIGALDRLELAPIWAKDIGALFATMEKYARTRESVGFEGNFLQWCDQQGGYLATKIAMTDSEPTLKNAQLRSTRVFAVSTDLDSSGLKLMVAHAKIQARGSGHIPRVFFYDDTRGKTKNIHIGFIGPHYLVPTSGF